MNAKTTRKKATRKKTPTKKPTGLTMAALCGAYLAHLETSGKSQSTVFSYGIDAKLALKHFGMDTEVAALNEKDIAAFNESEAVTRTRTGREKAKPTIDKTRRVLRLMLAWAAETGEIAAAPNPTKDAN